jgi:hypothetical protein
MTTYNMRCSLVALFRAQLFARAERVGFAATQQRIGTAILKPTRIGMSEVPPDAYVFEAGLRTML